MYKIAILGCENSHADAFCDYALNSGKISDVEIVGVYSDEEAANERLREKFGVYTAKSYDFYVDKNNYPMLRTLTSVTGAQCTSSAPVLSNDKKEGYVPGYSVYIYEFPMPAKTNVEAYENYFKPYIEYLDNDLGLEKLKVSGSELVAPFTEISHIYMLNNAQNNRLSVSWNLDDISERVYIMIMFLHD